MCAKAIMVWHYATWAYSTTEQNGAQASLGVKATHWWTEEEDPALQAKRKKMPEENVSMLEPEVDPKT